MKMHFRTRTLTVLPLAASFWLLPASAQTTNNQPAPAPTYQDRAPVPPAHMGDDDTTRRELASFDRFMDGHPEIAEQLKKDPSLVDNRDFVHNHPALQDYLNDHPNVREEIKENPNAFMHKEDRYERHEERSDNYRDRDRDNPRRDNDTTRRQLGAFDQFLDQHREVAEQLRKDPSLVDNREYVQNHPQLQQFLQDHPGVREEIKENPNAFMHQEDRYDRNENEKAQGSDRDNLRYNNADQRSDRQNDQRSDRQNNDRQNNDQNNNAQNNGQMNNGQQNYARRGNDGDTTHTQVKEFDTFMDTHPEIGEQVRKNPSLVDNPQFVKDHPALQTYLKEHPGISEEVKENPNSFMKQEQHYDKWEDKTKLPGETSAFGHFLGEHTALSAELQKDPNLIRNQEYLANHPELQDYLKEHPGAKAELDENPQQFIKSSQQGMSSNPVKTQPIDSKPKK